MENRTVPPLPTHNPSGVETSSHVPGFVPQHPEYLDPPQAADEMGRLAQYRVFKKLGQGGMGTVFQAEDPKLLRLVALKVMKPELAGNPEFRQRFLREARAMAAVEHDHIVAGYQVDTANVLQSEYNQRVVTRPMRRLRLRLEK
jgi:serine/threonine protein kinase